MWLQQYVMSQFRCVSVKYFCMQLAESAAPQHHAVSTNPRTTYNPAPHSRLSRRPLTDTTAHNTQHSQNHNQQAPVVGRQSMTWLPVQSNNKGASTAPGRLADDSDYAVIWHPNAAESARPEDSLGHNQPELVLPVDPPTLQSPEPGGSSDSEPPPGYDPGSEPPADGPELPVVESPAPPANGTVPDQPDEVIPAPCLNSTATDGLEGSLEFSILCPGNNTAGNETIPESPVLDEPAVPPPPPPRDDRCDAPGVYGG